MADQAPNSVSRRRLPMNRVLHFLFTAVTGFFFVFLATAEPSIAQDSAPAPAVTRPPIVGVAHIGLRTDDMAAARRFYTGLLGFQEPFSLNNPDGSLMLTYFKVNDHQY